MAECSLQNFDPFELILPLPLKVHLRLQLLTTPWPIYMTCTDFHNWCVDQYRGYITMVALTKILRLCKR